MADTQNRKKSFIRRHWFVLFVILLSTLTILTLYISNHFELRRYEKNNELKQTELIQRANDQLSESSKKHHINMARTMSWVMKNQLSEPDLLNSYFAQINTDGELKEVLFLSPNGTVLYSTNLSKVDQLIRPTYINKLKNIDELTVIDEIKTHVIGVPIMTDGRRSGVLILFGEPAHLVK